MKKLLFIIIVLSTYILAQQFYKDVIHLKNGDVAKGIIIENVPNDYVKLQTDNGSIITFKYVDISKFTREKVSKKIIKQQENTRGPINPNSNTNVESQQSIYSQNIQFIPYNSISIGYGNSYGGVGMKFEYRFRLVAIHGGVGYFPPPIEFAESAVLFSGGIKFFFSNRDLYLDLQFGTFGIEAKQLRYSSQYSITQEVSQKTLYGPSILLGNTIWFGSSVGLNCAVGASYNLVEIDWTDKAEVIYALDFGLTIKL